MSCEKFSFPSAFEMALRRASMAERWKRFCRENFQSAAHVALVFSVNGSTAENWWEGVNAPSAFAVDYAREKFPPEALAALQAQP